MSAETPTVITNKDAFLKRLFGIMRFQQQYPGFLEEEAMKIVNKEIIQVIHKRMAAARYSQKIIESTRAENLQVLGNGILEVDIISDYTTPEGAEAAEFREKGTKRWFNRPVRKLALHWIAAGLRAFSKGHWMPARPGSNIIKDTIAERLPIAQEKLDQATDEMLTKMLKS
jgi:hypothetical protein